MSDQEIVEKRIQESRVVLCDEINALENDVLRLDWLFSHMKMYFERILNVMKRHDALFGSLRDSSHHCNAVVARELVDEIFGAFKLNQEDWDQIKASMDELGDGDDASSIELILSQFDELRVDPG